MAKLPFILAMVAALALPGELAYWGSYVTLACGLLGLALLGLRNRRVWLAPSSLAIIFSISLIVATLPFVYRGDADLLAPLFLLPMLTTIGLTLLGTRLTTPPGALIFALICLAGSLFAAILGSYERFFLGISRVGGGNNPIHYGSLAAMIGSLALIGVVSTPSRWRYVFLTGPALGIFAAYLSGSRGPLLGAIVAGATGGGLLLIWNWRDVAFRRTAIALGIIGCVTLGFLVATENGRISSVGTTALNIFRFTGGSDDIRAALYASAIHTWLQAPIFGVGYGQIMDAVQTLYPEQPEAFTLENLHADWANFASMGGSLGLLAWLLMLTSPLLLFMDKATRADQPVVLGVIILTIGQFVLGISNAMFGVLPQTVLFATALGYLLSRSLHLRTVT